jgi:superfamily II DNA or RNA helicase
METGTGKTIVALETMKYLFEDKKIEAAVIVA